MDDDDEDRPAIDAGYAFGELARAFQAALTHEDPVLRRRASKRTGGWMSVIAGIATGRLNIGSRTPVAGLPAWVTPTVLRGGFATGHAEAEGPLSGLELQLAQRESLPQTRSAVFAFLLTERGLTWLRTLLESQAFRVQIPEDSALLTVAWLLAHGDPVRAAALTDTIAPFAGTLRFVPEPAADAPAPRMLAWRQTVGETRRTLAGRSPNERVEAMRETLEIWNPLADEALALWLETVGDGAVATASPHNWEGRARSLLAKYDVLARRHTRVRKHRRPKENLAILLDALRASLAGELTPRQRGLLQHAVDSMIARRGTPGSAEHEALRAEQAAIAERRSHARLAELVVHRLATEPGDRGLVAVGAVLEPVTEVEARQFALPVGTPIPRAAHDAVHRARAGTPEELVADGVVPSAEVLAELAPRITATAVGEAYADAALGELMAETYEAFRRRRTLLLLDLEHQVRFEELPWVQAVSHLRRAGSHQGSGAEAGFTRMARLTLETFPATITPNALVSELDVLARDAGLDLPLVEELAADIFMGRFSPKFLRAAQLAGELLGDSLYARYYAIDYGQVRDIDDLARGGGVLVPKGSEQFDALCRTRAGDPTGRWSAAANGTVIEQAQILTTHNLAALAGPRGIGERAPLDWGTLADRCFDHVLVLAGRLERNPRPLRTVKAIAYAWRQLIFFASLTGEAGGKAIIATAAAKLAGEPEATQARLEPSLRGLTAVAGGGTLDEAGAPRLLGWTVGPHPMLAERGEPGTRAS